MVLSRGPGGGRLPSSSAQADYRTPLPGPVMHGVLSLSVLLLSCGPSSLSSRKKLYLVWSQGTEISLYVFPSVMDNS